MTLVFCHVSEFKPSYLTQIDMVLVGDVFTWTVPNLLHLFFCYFG